MKRVVSLVAAAAAGTAIFCVLFFGGTWPSSPRYWVKGVITDTDRTVSVDGPVCWLKLDGDPSSLRPSESNFVFGQSTWYGSHRDSDPVFCFVNREEAMGVLVTSGGRTVRAVRLASR